MQTEAKNDNSIERENVDNSNEKLTKKNLFGYGIGAFGIMALWGLGSSMLTYYYTEVVGIAAGLVGTIIFLSRIFDGVSDIAMGYMVDNTKSKHGKARPWLLWLGVPFSISAVLVFSVPDIGTKGQIIYAVITNLLFILMYTGIRIPYNALIALMTKDQQERGMANIAQTIPGFLAGMIVAIAFIPIFNLLGGTKTAWFILVVILAILSALLVFITFRSTKERVGSADASINDNVPFLIGLKSMVKNKYAMLLLIMGIFLSAIMGLSASAGLYYAQYVLGDVNLMALIGAATSLPVIVSLFFIAPVVKKFGKRNSALGGVLLGIIGGLIKFIDPANFIYFITGSTLQTIGTVPLLAIGIALWADTVEYGEWKTGVRTEGLINSGAMFADKVGNGLGTALVGWTLALGGYVAGSTKQTDSVIQAIYAINIYIPIVFMIIVGVFLYFYKLDKHYPSIVAELAKRNEK
ncbi:MFS transporter [Metabacillus litoralis]|uniref:MFS transporter n=1 Tax=Metabacillus litoralis TaxID=152268 RepID=UPI00203EA871|nr:glycoside-pentoside-hexuronide (GPH):cation symporter [Metabacillus litoralis]MCM3160801.1 glycoside-pentoside-hexuronide (GPH):cation symporter [Metabacillus litoralis]